LHSDKDQQILFVSGLHTLKTNQDDGRPPFWKIEKRPYHRKDSNDRHEIWYIDEYWLFEQVQ